MPSKDEIVGRIMKAQEQLAHQLTLDHTFPLLAANLTMPQLKVLLVLWQRGDAAGLDLTSATRISPATMTGIVDRLVAQRLVTRREDRRDRRVRRIELTAAGREIVDSIMVAGAEHQRRLLGRLTLAELAIVEQAVEVVLKAADAEAAERG